LALAEFILSELR